MALRAEEGNEMGIVPNTETVEEVAFGQRATDPRLEQPQPQSETPETPETPAASEEPPEGSETPESTPETPKPRKTAEEVLKGRIGHMTKTLSTKDQELADARARLAAAEALLAGGTSSEETPQTPPTGARTYTQEEFQAEAARLAEVETFNQKADEMYNEGTEKFKDWKDTVDTLVASGFMNKDLLDAAMAVGNGAIVLHHLGTNLDEAERINALSPIRKAAELAKLSATLSTPQNIPVSGAPAPIRPVQGSPSPVVDLHRVADSDNMAEWAAARKKQGSRWAR